MFKVEEINKSFRRLVSERKITKSEILLTQKPLFYSVLSSQRQEFCNFCFKHKEDLKKCSQCDVIYYCSKECQVSDWKQHKFECKTYKSILSKKFKITSDFHLLMRIFLAKEKLSNFISNKHEFGEDKIRFFTEQAYMILKSLELEVQESDMDFLIDTQAKIATNALTIQDALFETNGIGVGIYETVNLLNHSCCPNVICVFDKSPEVKVVAIRDIAKGEEICNSYTDIRKLYPERQSFLKKNYFFTCECKRCISESEQGVQFVKCPKCKIGKINSNTLICSNCSSEKEPLGVSEYSKIISRMNELEQLCSKSSEIQIKPLVEEAESLCFKEAPQFCQILNFQIISKLGTEQYQEAYKLLKQFVKLDKFWYSNLIKNELELPFLGWKYNELSKLAFHLDKCKKAEIFSEKGLSILSKYYSPENCPELNDLYLRLRDIKSELKMKYS